MEGVIITTSALLVGVVIWEVLKRHNSSSSDSVQLEFVRPGTAPVRPTRTHGGLTSTQVIEIDIEKLNKSIDLFLAPPR